MPLNPVRKVVRKAAGRGSTSKVVDSLINKWGIEAGKYKNGLFTGRTRDKNKAKGFIHALKSSPGKLGKLDVRIDESGSLWLVAVSGKQSIMSEIFRSWS